MNSEAIGSKIDAAIRVFLYILIFWLPYSPAVIENCVIISLVLWLIKRSLLFPSKNDKNVSVRHRFKDWINAFKPSLGFLEEPFAFFIFACILSVIASAFFEQAVYGFVAKTLEWFIIYFLVLEVFKEKRHIEIAFAIFLFTALATCLDGIAQFYFTKKDVFCGRLLTVGGATAGFKHYNDFGGYLTFVVPIVFAQLFSRQRRWIRFLWVCAFILVTWVAVITFSRGSWLGIIIGILFALFFLRRKIFTVILSFFIVLTVSLYLFFPAKMKDKLRLNSIDIIDTTQSRTEMWKDSLVMIKDRPFFGHGTNMFMTVFQAYRSESVFLPTYAHNCYIQIAAETGLFGLVCFIWIMIRLLMTAIPLDPHFLSSLENIKLVLIGGRSGVLAFLVHSFFDTNFYSLKLSALFWFMAGVVVAADRLLNKQVNDAIRLS